MAGYQPALYVEAVIPGMRAIEYHTVGPGQIIGLQEIGARSESPAAYPTDLNRPRKDSRTESSSSTTAISG